MGDIFLTFKATSSGEVLDTVFKKVTVNWNVIQNYW